MHSRRAMDRWLGDPGELATLAAIKREVEIVVDLLVKQQYVALERLTRADRLTAEDMRVAIQGLGGTLIAIPDSGWGNLEIVQVGGAESAKFDAEVPLYTEQGCSDLWISLHLVERHRGAYDIRLLDIRIH